MDIKSEEIKMKEQEEKEKENLIEKIRIDEDIEDERKGRVIMKVKGEEN